ncbi:Disintegrin and metalloproteinase domain-containing protein 25-like [Homarus americanus]|uniref:Disintegrin and metalloproteinase domain-containing protein 25-like n=2 Tax=Homarus americanus TaxID=6706 RepID=A0A8J5MPS2_HOMAM|nr:Disintegrin and metalloproteinase domain-containing protein 25-like [Homarus americanus]
MCRAASSDCDLPEYCSGHSEYCPDDVHKKDGVTCRWGKGHCHQGGCGSHEGRCEHVWGINAQVAHHKCYSNFNSKGNGDGNCGKHPKYDQYLPCTPKTQHCGTLHCIPPSYSKTRFDDPHHNSTDQVDGHTCSFIIAYEAYPAQDWLSPDGAACGTDKMCINQKCVMIPSAGGDCAGGCSGHGVCNNLDHCHCDPGYSPPSCLFPGTGGSIDSGAVSEAQDYSGVITASWVLVTLVVTVLVIMCCFWGYIRRWWERRGRGCVSSKLPCCASCIDTCCCPIMTKFTHWLVTVGSSREKNRSVKKEIHTGDAEEGVDEAMVCSVDVDFKGVSHTNSWGVADQKLVTDVITITPKNSPDLRRKIQLPSNSPVLHRKSVDSLDRPNYFQSVSVDSGCVSDSDEGISGKHSPVHMSMTSLISAFRRFNTKRGTTPPENDSRRSRNLGSLKSMPLSRFVVDPLAGSRSSRQVTPPPDHMKHGFRRSISTDVTRGRHGGAPPPPPPSLKPHKSDDNLISSNKLANNHFLSSENGNIHKINSGTQSGSRSHHSSDDGSGVDSQAVRKPIMPFKKSLSPLKPSPPLPPLAKSKPYTASVGKNSATNRQNGNINKVPLKPPQIMTSNNQLRTGGSAANNTTNSGNTTKKKNVLDMARKFEAL